MDSEDDMHDANDVDSLDDFYSGDTGMASDDGDEDGDYGFNDSSDSDDTTSHRQQQNYTILNEEDIRQRQEEDITNISTVLSISEISASILLRHYNWSVGKVHDAWFADEEKVRKAVGLLEKPVIQIPNIAELTCGICFEAYLRDRMKAAACGHLFCSSCWTGYISNSINDGPGCLMLRCPDPSCGAAVGQDMISLLASNEDKQKYSRYLLRSYVEDNKKTKWCPAPGCEYAVDFVVGSSCYDVSCNCTHSFCWNCTEEAHRPVDCSTVAKWILKNSAESENMNWILANSKPCPKCKRPIEKNQGCMHITCTPPCKFEFCCKKRAGSCSENIKQEMVGKKDKCSKRNGKGSMKKFTDMKGKQNLLSIFAEARNLCQKKDGECKRSYSRNELEALRFVNGDDQRQIWKEIYTGLGPIVAKELNNMADSRKQNRNGANGKNCKNTVLLQHAEKQKADAPILGLMIVSSSTEEDEMKLDIKENITDSVSSGIQNEVNISPETLIQCKQGGVITLIDDPIVQGKESMVDTSTSFIYQIGSPSIVCSTEEDDLKQETSLTSMEEDQEMSSHVLESDPKAQNEVKYHDGTTSSLKSNENPTNFPSSVSKTGYGCERKEMGKKRAGGCSENIKQEMVGKKDKCSKRNGKGSRKKFTEMKGKQNLLSIFAEARNLCQKKDGECKRSYSRNELEALRFVNGDDQRQIWKEIYTGLGPIVAKELNNMADSRKQNRNGANGKNCKNTVLLQHAEKQKADAPILLGDSSSQNVEGNLEENIMGKAPNFKEVNPRDIICDDHKIVEEDEFEDDESYEDEYDSIKKPAFCVDGDPDFDSGPPQDGLEYLRRVRWEAAQIPNVKVVQVDRSKLNKEQTVYMPEIPEIARCPKHLQPSKEWEDQFLADFSKLRLALSHLEGSKSFPHVTVAEVDETLRSSRDPTLSIILGMDSVSRVSMLKRCIKSLDTKSSLSRNSCSWIFALCAAVDIPLHADTTAFVRSLLRKCASWRAEISESDLDNDEVVMLNMLVTISGRYFGQLD